MVDQINMHQIDFAKRHIATGISTFNAGSALMRLENLIEEAKTLNQELAPILEKRWQPAFFEFSSYYQVGFVTCLEWHAKSRLFDLLNYSPSLITSEDIKSSNMNRNLPSMASERLTIPHLIASSSNITTLEKYIAVFERVLDAIGRKSEVHSILNAERGDDGSSARLLNELYHSRNLLVHEISISTIGHPNIRDFRTLGEVINIGEAVRNVIKSIEKEISEHAPFDFPNLLDSDYYSVTKIEVLARKIKEVEEQIRSILLKDVDYAPCSIQKWDNQVRKAHEYVDCEINFIEELDLPGRHYYDSRFSIHEVLLECRLNYLKFLKQETVGDDELQPD